MSLDFSLLTPSSLLNFLIAFLLTFAVIAWLLKRQHPILRSVPGVTNVYYAGAILVGVIVSLSYFVIADPSLIIGLLAASFFILFIGIRDENTPLSPGQQLTWQIVIALLAVSWGWVIQYVSHPSGSGIIFLNQLSWGPFIWPGTIITVIWLLLLMNAMNWLDGSDGLAAGVGTIAFLALGAVALLPSIYDTRTLTLALIGAGAFSGFLIWNFPRARVYLGTTGSWFLGLYLGLVALLSGGKIVTTLLVLAWPVFDLMFVALERFLKHQPPWQGDTTTHLHHRLLNHGFSPRTLALGAISATILFSALALILQTKFKLLALVIMAGMMAIIGFRIFLPRHD